jgi:cobalt/nickel transport system permease protein
VNSATLNLYQTKNSPVHRLDPRVKVVLTLLAIISNVALPDGAWLAFGVTWLLLLAVAVLSNIKFTFLMTRAGIVLPFTLAAVTTVFSTPGETLFTLPFLGWEASPQGLTRFGSIMTRSWLSVQTAILLSATTKFPDLMHALRHLKIPTVLVSTISFMYRYLFVLLEEARRLIRARSARSAKLPDRKSRTSLSRNVKIGGSMVGQLFLRSIERSERIYQAMQDRGYRGHLLTLNPHVMHTKDWLTLSGGTLLLLLIQTLVHFR